MRAACFELPAAALLSTLLVGCADSTSETSPPVELPTVPWAVTEFPKLSPSVTDVPEERVALGRLLFFDPIMSIDSETTCGSCHSEFWGLSDQLPVALGHGAGPVGGPFREGTNFGRRNTPALFNIGLRETFLWDGGASSLEEQAIMPLRAEEELALDPEVFIERLSDRSVYDAYVNGFVDAFDEELVEGMFRFAAMGCDECHTPPLFESEIFANRNVPPREGIEDDGLAEITELPEDRGKFRTPSLRNAHATEPFFHNGSAFDLASAVRHELEQSGQPFTDDDVYFIERFVHRGLRDTSRAPVRPKTVPSGLQVPEDFLP